MLTYGKKKPETARNMKSKKVVNATLKPADIRNIPPKKNVGLRSFDSFLPSLMMERASAGRVTERSLEHSAIPTDLNARILHGAARKREKEKIGA